MISGHVFIATSLDGFIARKDGNIDWLMSRDDSSEDHGYDNFIKEMDGLIMGRGTFEKVRDFEPWPYTLPVVVLSSKLVHKDVPEKLVGKVRFLNLGPLEVMKLMEREGWKKVYVDGGRVIQSFIREKLIEDIVITRVPVLIGEGIPLFGALTEDQAFKHLETKVFPSGLVQSQYQFIE